MAFRVELSDQAQTDIATIYDWLRPQPRLPRSKAEAVASFIGGRDRPA